MTPTFVQMFEPSGSTNSYLTARPQLELSNYYVCETTAPFGSQDACDFFPASSLMMCKYSLSQRKTGLAATRASGYAKGWDWRITVIFPKETSAGSGSGSHRTGVILTLRRPPRLAGDHCAQNSSTCFCNVKEQSGCRSGARDRGAAEGHGGRGGREVPFCFCLFLLVLRVQTFSDCREEDQVEVPELTPKTPGPVVSGD